MRRRLEPGTGGDGCYGWVRTLHRGGVATAAPASGNTTTAVVVFPAVAPDLAVTTSATAVDATVIAAVTFPAARATAPAIAFLSFATARITLLVQAQRDHLHSVHMPLQRGYALLGNLLV